MNAVGSKLRWLAALAAIAPVVGCAAEAIDTTRGARPGTIDGRETAPVAAKRAVEAPRRGCTFQVRATEHHASPLLRVPLRLAADGPAFGRIQDGSATIRLVEGSPAPGAIAEIEAQGFSVRGTIAPADLPLYLGKRSLARGFLVAETRTGRVRLQASGPGYVRVALPATPVVRLRDDMPVVVERSCAEVSFVPMNDHNATRHLPHDGQGDPVALAEGVAVPLSLRAGDEPVADIVPDRCSLAATVVERAGGAVRIVLHTSDRDVFGWVPEGSVDPVSHDDEWPIMEPECLRLWNSRWRKPAPNSRGGPRWVCDTDVPLSVSVGVERAAVGVLRRGSVFTLDRREAEIARVVPIDSSVLLEPDARFDITTSDLDRCVSLP